ncbi:MAG: hypothetical protein COV45_04530 [Deltaproteobacteria bacterium CG11_big_fil_rev_8_21_14_0_20_47_16]|nr:MAG: hypothetical protein COV45_04530 [Deltaproteobacteria bacterium CG11_big_fil_rev_8_21_14_0_20_47_16]
MKRLLCVVAVSVLALSHCATSGNKSNGSGQSVKPTKGTFRIGVVLPLSGKYKLYGESAFHGIECAAGVVDPCTSPIHVELIVKDSRGDAATAATAVEELVAQDHVMAIIGPLMSREVIAAAQKAQQLQVPLISLSQKDGVTDIGNFIFRVALNTSSQVDTLVDYAVKQKGYKTFGILYPTNAYGLTFRAAFAEAVTKAGGRVVAERGYGEEIANIVDASSQQDAPPVVRSRSGVGTDGTWHEAGKSTRSSVPIGSEIPVEGMSVRPKIPTIKGAEVIFIPDSYRAVVNMVQYGDADMFKGVQLLGTNRWDESGLLDVASNVDGAVFVDGFFANSDNIGVQKFVETFRQAYQIKPTILEAQAYDATLMVEKAIERGGRKPASMRNALDNLSNVKGLIGRISFGPGRDAEKQLVLLTVSNGSIVELRK